ncbi:20501_t:CDS:1 [Dentiscutata erythropus]|uniref:20501_t:CDS:1 n=1 Tax=Dentiscutata erythropus TaxID=1348616 RepID=A0A9N9EDB2_9GLOM|nr:20501_t:CDS:1 [Dentiscutata erythropus]
MTPDCFAVILDYLQDDKATLHSCVLINRMWCRLTVPLLWSRPFSLVSQNKINTIERNAALIISTYVSCFSDSERQQLIDEGFDLPLNYSKPFFDYTRYLRSMDAAMFDCAVQHWAKLNSHKSGCWFNTTAYMAGLAFKRTIGLKSLNFTHMKDFSIENLNLSSFTSTYHALSKLSSFELVYYPTHSFFKDATNTLNSIFSTLADCATNLIDLKISINKRCAPPIDQIFRLIKSQSQLQVLKTNEFWSVPEETEEFCAVLSTQAKSLRWLEFSEITYIPIELVRVLMSCHRLETLEFRGFDSLNLNSTNNDNQDTTKYDDNFNDYRLNIENLHVFRNSLPSTVINLLSLTHSQNLKKLAIEKATIEIIDTLQVYCPNVTNLSLCTTNSICPNHALFSFAVQSYLVNSHLERFTLRVFDEFCVDLVRDIVSTIPNSLKRLGLDFDLSIEDLRSILECSKVEIITLELHYSWKMNLQDFINVINWYSETINKKLRNVRLYLQDAHLNKDSNILLNVGDLINEHLFFEVVNLPNIPLS